MKKNNAPFVRGFKKFAEDLAREARHELKLSTTAPFDPYALAAHLQIPVMTINDLVKWGASPVSVEHLLTNGREEFSAATLFRGFKRLIIENPSHSRMRRVSSVAHELAHVLLEHEIVPTFADDGCRFWNAKDEAEADWLAGVLLVPRIVALQIARSGVSSRDAAGDYGVSVRMMEWRLNQTGARAQARREGYLRARPKMQTGEVEDRSGRSLPGSAKEVSR